MRRRLAGLAAILALLVALWLDPWIWRVVPYSAVDSHDWGRLLRVTGSLFFWLPLALAVWLEARARNPRQSRRAWLLFAGPVLAGAAAEALKLLVRRERPGLHDGAWFHRPFGERPFDTHDLAFPSGHVTVAFAGAAVIARQFPRAAPVAYLLAAGCAVSRILAQAHFVSDVVGAALLGWAIGAWVAGRGRQLPSDGPQL